MNSDITAAAAAEHGRELRSQAAAHRRARLVAGSVQPRNPGRRGIRCTHHVTTPVLAWRCWLAAGQL